MGIGDCEVGFLGCVSMRNCVRPGIQDGLLSTIEVA